MEYVECHFLYPWKNLTPQNSVLGITEMKLKNGVCDIDCTVKDTKPGTKTSRAVSDVSNEIRQAAQSKGSNAAH